MSLLKITRKRLASSYLHKLEMYGMQSGSNSVMISSLRWNRLQLCIDSVEIHLKNTFNMYGIKV